MRAVAAVLLLACAPPPAPADVRPSPPVAPVRPYVHTEHGVERPDPYAWMGERGDDLRAYVASENAWAESATARLAPLRAELLAEMEARVDDEGRLPPVRIGEWSYQERYEPGAEHPLLVRRRYAGPEEVVVDTSTLAGDAAHFEVGGTVLDPTQRTVAVCLDFEGDEIYEVRFRDLQAGAWLPDVLVGVVGCGAWADPQTFFTTRPDEALRPATVHRHVLGTDPSADPLVYREDDRRFTVSLSRTRSGRFLVLSASSTSTTEIRVLDTATPAGTFDVLVPRRDGVLAQADHQGDRFLVRTNGCDDGTPCAIGFRVVALDGGGATEIVPHREGVTIEDIAAFARHFVVAERRDGATRYVVHDRDGDTREMEPPEPFYDVWFDENPEYEATSLRFVYTSLLVPDSIFLLDFETGALDLRDQVWVPDYVPSRFRTERLSATSADGTAVPITLVRADDAPMPGPVVLYGYAAYGTDVDPWFDPARVSLLRRGVTFALCHARGGGDLGQAWTLAGRREQKQHSFDDFAACARRLVETGHTTPDRLAAYGESAGGLLVAATVNQHPDAFRAAVLRVPFVDAVTTMLDDSLPLTAEEWEEWGDPRQREDFDRMLAWSPYDNIGAHPYPDLLVVSGWNDTSVLVHEPAKYVARLRSTATGGQVLFRTDMEAGHGGASGRYGPLADEAFAQAWLLDRLGVSGP